jgi:hypothetical protein
MGVPARTGSAVVSTDSGVDLRMWAKQTSERRHQKVEERQSAARIWCDEGVQQLWWSGCSELGSTSYASQRGTSRTYAQQGLGREEGGQWRRGRD